MTITVPPDYRPRVKEPFMNSKQQEYFRLKLQNWREELLKESEETLESLQEGGVQEPDLADRASTEMERSFELRTRDRARKLISKIDAALRRIEEGTYGYCEETGEPIGLKRLMA
ncbi:MAG TPA: RNA polymerase-binding protein DksA, partial [Rhodospirillaceae bacterium]|nr:RNA polymerase-binding protein DksA [Rhodospirillaceae bacterium]